ncbi:hypothetical protein J2Y52_002679 [Aminobacter sp. BE110]
MLDLETFGTLPGSVIRSIGAVQFDLRGNTGKTFYANIEPESCKAVGLVIDLRTEQWWSEQSKAAQQSLLIDQLPLKAVAVAFRSWFHEIGGEQVWGQGANFDIPLWEAASLAVSVPPPWKFWNVRDTRTVYDLFDFDTRELAIERVKHNALDDARHQVRLVAAALRHGRPPTPVVEDVFG